jgi:hypothetical protein
MSFDDDSNSEPKQAPNSDPNPMENDAHTGWLYALNAFLEGAFLEADRDTGC